MKKIILTGALSTMIISLVEAQTLIDDSGSTIFRNPTISGWTGTTKLTLSASSVQNSGFTLSYEADSNPRVGRLTLNNNWAGIFGDFAISLRNGNDPSTDIHERFRIKANNGFVGIGTANPDALLAVNGTIHTKEVKVDITNWSDFVFENDYRLRTLEEMENYISENKHLPEIPEEEEVTKNGINLGEMNAKLLQKIEELTLYLIEQNKQNQAQQEQLETQSALIEQLKNEVNTLKNK